MFWYVHSSHRYIPLVHHSTHINSNTNILFYSDGQAIANKLSKQINKVSNSLQKTLCEFNALLSEDDQITYEDAKDPKSSLYSTVRESVVTMPAAVSASVKREVTA